MDLSEIENRMRMLESLLHHSTVTPEGDSNVDLNDLNNVDVSGVSNDDSLTWDSSSATWINEARVKSVSESAPIEITGTTEPTVSLNYNETNLKLTSDELDTIQNIDTTASPEFVGLTLSGLPGAVGNFITFDASGELSDSGYDGTNFANITHASTHESGGSDTINHDNLDGFEANEHIDWTDATENFKTTESITALGDNTKIITGEESDMSVYYDGTDGYIKTNEVTDSDLIIACGTDKTLTLEETVWDDINLGSAQLSKPASSHPDIDSFVDNTGTDTGIETYAFGVGEKVHGAFELIHTYKEGTDLKPHVHFQIVDAPSGTDHIRWQIAYTIAKGGAILGATETTEGECAVDTQYENYFCALDDIDGTDLEIGDQFLFTLERIASIDDAFAGDALIQTVGVHHEVDTIGSRQVSTK